jgi:hypothetical protein
MPPEIVVGTVVIAKRGSGKYDIYAAGERGVCYDASECVGDPMAYLVIFEGGGCECFRNEELPELLEVTGFCEAVADYKFVRYGQLRKDFNAGRFAAAFQHGEAGQGSRAT